MAYATALGSKSIYLTLPGLIGYSLPAFYFFHMSSFYVPDKLKLVCQVCKYILGAPFWVMGSITDGIMVNPEEIYFGEEVPIDFVWTGGTISGDFGDIDKLCKYWRIWKILGKKHTNLILSAPISHRNI
mgnify:CR=1 FL=1